jgi:hypothetical protein
MMQMMKHITKVFAATKVCKRRETMMLLLGNK